MHKNAQVNCTDSTTSGSTVISVLTDAEDQGGVAEGHHDVVVELLLVVLDDQ
jgi:hypothetical protein